jgi:hypothetical protein
MTVFLLGSVALAIAVLAIRLGSAEGDWIVASVGAAFLLGSPALLLRDR